MQTVMTGPSVDPGWLAPDAGDGPCLEIEGLEGSALRATMTGLIVAGRGSSVSERDRFWAYPQLLGIRLDAYGSIGVIRATVRSSSTELPLLLLEPDQITAARRGLEMVWNLMGSTTDRSEPS